MAGMTRLTDLAQSAVRLVLQPGESAIDATAGNGHDTRFLVEVVGPQGQVFAFDIQPEALERTRTMLATAGHVNVSLIEASHARLLDRVPVDCHGEIGAVMFNLGYLPGGDKSIITQTADTIAAIRAGWQILRPDGILTVMAYPGHPGGHEEMMSIRSLLPTLSPPDTITEHPSSRENGPILWILKR